MLNHSLSNKKLFPSVPLALCLLILPLLLMTSCAPHQARKGFVHYHKRGKASWYGPGFAGRKTANGERFNPSALTAAHKTLPFDTTVRVTNLTNQKSVIVRINDRGPYAGGRIIDLSKAAAKKIGLLASGVSKVEILSIGPNSDAKATPNAVAKAEPRTLEETPLLSSITVASRGPVRRNGVEYLISVDQSEHPQPQIEAPEQASAPREDDDQSQDEADDHLVAQQTPTVEGIEEPAGAGALAPQESSPEMPETLPEDPKTVPASAPSAGSENAIDAEAF